ncbi:uncharacterized protein BXZ73DRAFT_45905 [Epithele typhae]|uniref:uncharacterized protein n=1 Tax=Epithele typhae TaxID=378194 RepID=UPI002007EBAB|nr:uncharacterized protein BXZ73DRAFT_45905 [Epithele typhae]KAH9934003.1 hypothetical protein BXZ73DRAFT_45905 [Epithele typhae]
MHQFLRRAPQSGKHHSYCVGHAKVRCRELDKYLVRRLRLFIDTEEESSVNQTTLVDNDAQTWKVDPEFSFEDATVTLVAENVGFRVYGGVLAGHSKVLKKLLAVHHMGETTTNSRKLELCLPDTARDWRYVLRVCFTQEISLRFRLPTAEEIFAYVRIGHKYCIQSLYNRSIEFLKRFFGTDYFGFYKVNGSIPKSFSPVHAIGVVNIAHFVGESSMLPLALRACCLLSVPRLLVGFEYSDGKSETLSAGDVVRCLTAKPQFASNRLSSFLRIITPFLSSHCVNLGLTGKPCREAAMPLLDLAQSESTYLGQTDRQHGLSIVLCDSVLEQLCPSCRTQLGEVRQAERYASWNKIPSILGLECPEWKNIKVRTQFSRGADEWLIQPEYLVRTGYERATWPI